MRRGMLVFLLTILLSLPVVQGARAQDDLDTPRGTQLGLMTETSFGAVGPALGRALLGFKIQTPNLGITPKLGLGVLDTGVTGVDPLLQFDIGCGVDYYFNAGRIGKLRPYVGGDFILGIIHQADTAVAITLYPHLGAEYRLSRKFSLGGNIGPDFTIITNGDTAFGFGFNGVLQLTYYFN